jgi:TonB-dependent SusC/RagA subfamily outer membrane receptor
MTVLKGETGTSLYGSKATNGVIIITTKDGKGLTKKEVLPVNGEVGEVKEITIDGVKFRPSEKTDQNGNLNEVVVVGYGKNNDENKVFVKVEEVAQFPGGEKEWSRYLERNLNAQVPANNKAPQGSYTVIVKFIVGLKGDITELKSVTTNGYGMEEEVIRVLTKGPKWVPARQNGRDVISERTQPVKFVVAPR